MHVEFIFDYLRNSLVKSCNLISILQYHQFWSICILIFYYLVLIWIKLKLLIEVNLFIQIKQNTIHLRDTKILNSFRKLYYCIMHKHIGLLVHSACNSLPSSSIFVTTFLDENGFFETFIEIFNVGKFLMLISFQYFFHP